MPTSESSNYTVWYQLILVLLLSTGAMWLQLPIQSERPAPSGHGVRSGVLQNRDARLWQDPFGVVAQSTQGKLAPDCATLTCGNPGLGEQIAQRSQQAAVQVLIAMVPGGTWVPADERRRRTRYAILAGLNAQNYAPIDAEHLGYEEAKVHGVRVSMPYEWLIEEGGKRFLLVIWLDGEALGQEILGAEVKHSCPTKNGSAAGGISTCPVSRLARILENLAHWKVQGKSTQRALSITVIGPSSSSFLTAAAQDTGLDQALATLKKLNVHWYSPFATLPQSEIKNRANQPLVLPNFQRVIASDDALAEALVGELELRHFGSGAAVALVGQWDTAYARTLREILKKKIHGKKIVEASYLRGLDARLPGKESSAKETSDKERKESSVTERPEGEAQIDYLRRLAGQLKSREKSEGRIGAIGVLGNDYYDKLLVLQALRPAFPDAVFFTTDLDAAMLHEKDNRYTRNLIVASGYGLSLSPGLQEDIPPFRDGYQSATYLATRLALYNGDPQHQPLHPALIAQWLKPQLFEIGRSAAVPLTPPPPSAPCNDLSDCSYPHVGASSAPDLFVDAIPFGVLACWIIGVVSGLTRLRQFPYWLLALLIAFGAGFLVKYDVDGEPAAWLQGVSIWPSEFLRILAFVLALVLLCRGIGHLRNCRAQCDADYFKRQPEAASGAQGHWFKVLYSELRGCFSALRRMFSRLRYCYLPARHVARDAEAIWDTYNRRRSDDPDTPSFLCLPFWFNGGLFIASMLLLGLALQGMGLPAPQAPFRGAYAFVSDKIITVAAVLAFESLLFLAVYESFRAVWLARALLYPTRWPSATIAAYWPVTAAQPDDARFDAWMDVRFIADVTTPVQRIIFYPFTVLALLILARSSLFDRWYIPATLWIIFLISIFLIVVAALRLRSCAEKVRGHSIRILNDQLLSARARGEKDQVEQISALLTQVKELKLGAFAPLSQQPLVRAVLTVAGSVSGIALLEYASLANF